VNAARARTSANLAHLHVRAADAGETRRWCRARGTGCRLVVRRGVDWLWGVQMKGLRLWLVLVPGGIAPGAGGR